jgi:cytidine deaminase
MSCLTNEDAQLSIGLFIFTALSILRGVRQQRKPSPPEKKDAKFLKQAHQIRLALKKPQHSHFRVVALLLLDDDSVIAGANDEPSPTLSGSICAERATFLRLRIEEVEKGTNRKVRTVYIVSDAAKPVPPGLLCREYMYGHAACSTDTRVVMQSAEAKEHPVAWISTLKELYPYPSIYMGLDVNEQVKMGTIYANEYVRDDESMVQLLGMSKKEIDQLVQAAKQATDYDNHDSIHAMRYGAAVALLLEGSTIEIVTASQRKAVEYGSSLDPVCQLALSMFRPDGTRQLALAIVMVDQFGNAHAPFAPARSFLAEHGFGGCFCILNTRGTDGALRRHAVPADDLAPFVPQIFK